MESPVQYEFMGDGTSTVFMIGSVIINRTFVKIHIDSEPLVDTLSYDIANNSIIFREAPLEGVKIEVWVAQGIEALGNLGTTNSVDIVAENIGLLVTIAELVAQGGYITDDIYDTNSNGIIDNAELINGLEVLTAVPANAVFTDEDTVYDDTLIRADVDDNTDSILLNTANILLNTNNISTNRADIATNSSDMLLNTSALSNLVIGVDVQAYNANYVIDGSYVHTDNNLTDAMIVNHTLGYNHSVELHAPTDADNTALNETTHSDVLVDSDTVSPVTTTNKLITIEDMVVGGGSIPAGIVSSYTSGVIPQGNLLLDGSTYQNTEYPFLAIQQNQGGTTFTLQDLRGVPIYGATTAEELGTIIGDDTVDIDHDHSYSGSTAQATEGDEFQSAHSFLGYWVQLYNHIHSFSGTTSTHNQTIDKRTKRALGFWIISTGS